MMDREAEFVIHKVYDGRDIRQGSEVGRVTSSTYKWGPSNAFQKFVREQHPPEGRYLVVGDQHVPSHRPGPSVFSVFELRYPEFSIGGGSDGWKLYGSQGEE